MKTKFTVDYFIKKFEAIPERFLGEWITVRGKKNCPIGHCRLEGEGHTLGVTLFFQVLRTGVGTVIHKRHPQYQQPTPKQRILAALYDIKKLQEKESPDYTIQLSVSSGEIMEHLTEAKLQLS